MSRALCPARPCTRVFQPKKWQVHALNEFPRGRNLTHVKSGNLSTVLEAVFRLGPISRTEISFLTGLTSSTITNLVNELIYHGLVRESGSAASQGGRRRTLLNLNEDACWLGAIVVQEDHIHGALLNLAAKVCWCTEEPYTGDPVPACEQLGQRLLALAAARGRPIVGLGVASGPHVVFSVSAMRGLQLPIVMDTEARVSALGEAWFGVGSEAHSLAFVSTDNPAAVGMVVERRLYRGAHGMAGFLLDAAPAKTAAGGHALPELAMIVALTMGLYDPEIMVLGGSLAEQFLELSAALVDCDFRPVLHTSQLGREVVVVGAACQILQEFIAHPVELLTAAKTVAEVAAGS